MRAQFGILGKFGQVNVWAVMGLVAWSIGLTPKTALAQGGSPSITSSL